MKVSWNYLKSVLPLEGYTPEQVAEKLTFAGAEVETITRLASATNLVIGQILSCVPHPDSDHLHILQVDEGEKYGVHQIVCGAPNARTGLKVIVARAGAVLPLVTIKPSAIRGVESDGMCCALYELGVDKKYLSEKQCAGIEELPIDAKVGEENVLGYLGLDDAILDLDVLPNRADLYALDHVAEEVACLLKLPLKKREFEKVAVTPMDFVVDSATPKCPQFSARLVKGVKAGPSPKWLVDFLRSEGIRSIDSVVDVGNYVMLLTGQPLNMYDADKLPAQELTVRDDFAGEFKAMDGKSYPLIQGDLVVCSQNQPMCLAGIMTSDACRVDGASHDIVVEAANFAYASIRHTSSRLGLISDSSQRFVKGINPDQAEEVQEFTAYLLKTLCGATSFGPIVNFDTLKHEKKEIHVGLNYINSRLGTNFSDEEVRDALKRDGLTIQGDPSDYDILVPSQRIDMEGKADVSEEVIRILGYEHVPSTLPKSQLVAAGLTDSQAKERSIRHYLLGNGVSQILTYTLVSQEEAKKFAYLNLGEPYVLQNPMTDEHEAVRPNLLHSVLLSASYNAARKQESGAFFEVSDVDSKSVSGRHLAIVLFGKKPLQGSLKEEPYSFYDVKGLLQGILDLLGLGSNRVQLKKWSLGGEEFHPGRSAELRMGKNLLGVLGELHPTACKEYGLKNAAVLELDLATLLSLKVSPVKATIPSKFPSVSRDLALILPKDTTFEAVAKEIKKADKLVESVSVFDLYEGANIAPNKKSLALTVVFSSPDHTLKDAEIKSSLDKVVNQVKVSFGAELRAS